MCVRGTLWGGEEWVSGEGSGLVSEVRLGDWDIVRVRGGLPLVERARELARLGESEVCGGFRRTRMAKKILRDAGGESCSK